MIVTHKINMDLTRRGSMPCIDVMQGDKYSRELEIHLRMNGEPFVLPEECRVMVNYSKTIGKHEIGGIYDTMPDGSVAWHIDGDTVTVGLEPQLCATAGKVRLMVTLIHGDAELGCFGIELEVQGKPSDKARREAYVNVNGFLPQPGGAQVGQYLEIQEVDDFGRVVKLQPVDLAEPDWSANEGKPGHVRNRTHWAETGNIDPNWDGDMTGREVLPMDVGVNLVKIADHVLTEQECVGATMTVATGTEGESFSATLSESNIVDISDGLGISCFMATLSDLPAPWVAVVRETGIVQGMEVSAGTYYLSLIEDGDPIHTAYFSALNYAGEVVHKLDSKFLPDGLMWEKAYLADRTHWTDDDGTVHQLDKKYIPAEWIAERTMQPATEYVPPTEFVSTPGSSTSISGSVSALPAGDYIIVYDGETYLETRKSGTNYNVSVGDESFVKIQYNARGKTWKVFTNDETASSHTVALYAAEMTPVPMPEEYLPGTVPVVQTASVGQIVAVKAVDVTGKPVAWECIDLQATVNEMINSKLSEIANAEEVAF